MTLSANERAQVRVDIQADLSEEGPRGKILALLAEVKPMTSYFNGTTPEQLDGTNVADLDRMKLEAAVNKVEGLEGSVTDGVLAIVITAEEADPDGSAAGHNVSRFADPERTGDTV